MFRIVRNSVLFLALLASMASVRAAALNLDLIGQYQTGVFDAGACEISAYDPASQRLFVVSAAASSILILDLSDPSSPALISTINGAIYGGSFNSVDVHNGIVAAAVEATVKQDPGSIVFFDANGAFLAQYPAGALPDMIKFTPDGNYVLSANEGEPNAAYTIDPQGTVTIVDVSGGVIGATVATVSFTSFNGQEAALRAQGIRIFGPNADASEDFEPEYIAVSANSQTAYLTLQENNAIAIIDIATASVTSLAPLGFINRSLPGKSFDPSDRDNGANGPAIVIGNWPVYSMFNPDAIASYEVGGQTYLVTANEGDVREYTGFAENIRVGAGAYGLDAVVFPNAATLKQNANLGRLTVTTMLGNTDADPQFEEIYTFGGRSFSIWDENGALVFDSGNDFETRLAAIFPTNFNSTNSANGSFDTRSDDKGPEPEAVTVANVCGHWYAFIGLERVGGIFVYDITNPSAPVYVNYINSRDFSVAVANNPASLAAVVELGPEGILYVDANDSPNGLPLLIMSNEINGSVTIYQVTRDVVEYTGPGSYCVEICSESPLLIDLNTTLADPYVEWSYTSGCNIGSSNCDRECVAGVGPVNGSYVNIDGSWYLSLIVAEGGVNGCFCVTLEDILPVEFGSFAAVAGNREVVLNWNTLTENNNDRFEITRNDELLANVSSLGNSVNGHNYSWTDHNVNNNVIYSYTLTSVSVDGSRDVLATASATPTANAGLPVEFALNPAYPNPFNPTTSISFSLPEAEHVSLNVFDINGRQVASLVNGAMNAGSHSASFDAANLSSGLYFARMTAGSFSASQKLVLMK